MLSTYNQAWPSKLLVEGQLTHLLPGQEHESLPKLHLHLGTALGLLAGVVKAHGHLGSLIACSGLRTTARWQLNPRSNCLKFISGGLKTPCQGGHETPKPIVPGLDGRCLFDSHLEQAATPQLKIASSGHLLVHQNHCSIVDLPQITRFQEEGWPQEVAGREAFVLQEVL